MSKPLIVSAPGKVILHGEHAVVYGKAALATSLDLRCYLVLTQAHDKRVTLHLPGFVTCSDDSRREWDVADLETAALGSKGGNHDHEDQLRVLKKLAEIKDDETVPSILSMAMLVFLYLLVNIYGVKLKNCLGLRATVISNLPAGAGLGSSAAYSVCLAAGFLNSCGLVSAPSSTPSSSNKADTDTRNRIGARMSKAGIEFGIGDEEFSWSEEDLELINRWGFRAETLIHGTPSGIDNGISTYGGAISFKSGVISHLEKMPSVRILLINTKVPRSTKKMVAGVRDKYDRFTSVVSPILESIDNITKTAQCLLQQLGEQQVLKDSLKEDTISPQLEELFSFNQHLLNALGVGHPTIDRVCQLAASLGLHSKLTGGGGGGCVIALLPSGISEERLSEFKGVFQDASFECWETNIACGGATLHSVNSVTSSIP